MQRGLHFGYARLRNSLSAPPFVLFTLSAYQMYPPRRSGTTTLRRDGVSPSSTVNAVDARSNKLEQEECRAGLHWPEPSLESVRRVRVPVPQRCGSAQMSSPMVVLLFADFATNARGTTFTCSVVGSNPTGSSGNRSSVVEQTNVSHLLVVANLLQASAPFAANA